MTENLKDDVAEVRSSSGQFEVHSAGAHVTKWEIPDFGEMIFVSRKSGFGVGVPVRGGIPICFPWFGDPVTWDDGIQLLGGAYAKAKHGFARKVNWRLVESVVSEGGPSDGGLEWSVTYELTEEDLETQGYPDVEPFVAVYRVDFSSVALELSFAVVNTGDKAFRFESALHTYFTVGDVRNVEVAGLDGLTYSDKTAGGKLEVQSGPITFGEEVDSVYQTDRPLQVRDGSTDRTISIDTQNSETTVVWNPAAQGAAAMADMGDEEWIQFVCVETANAREGAVVLEPGQAHRMSARYTVSRSS